MTAVEHWQRAVGKLRRLDGSNADKEERSGLCEDIEDHFEAVQACPALTKSQMQQLVQQQVRPSVLYPVFASSHHKTERRIAFFWCRTSFRLKQPCPCCATDC